jgi:hypothetical protein
METQHGKEGIKQKIFDSFYWSNYRLYFKAFFGNCFQEKQWIKHGINADTWFRSIKTAYSPKILGA